MASKANCAARFALTVGLLFPLGLTQPSETQGALPNLPDPGAVSMSRAQQEQLGLNAAKQVYQQMPVLPDNSLETQYVRKIGNRLVAAIPRSQMWPYQFHVLAEKGMNAFTLPGGEIFISSGTIIAARDEAQLAGVIAHEMAHVYMQHTARQIQQAQLSQGQEGTAGATVGNMGGEPGAFGTTEAQAITNLMTLRYTRGDEAQADNVGARIMQRAGYNPMELANFFNILEAQSGTPSQFLSDHPNPGNREEAIRNEIRSWPPENYRTDNAEFTAVCNHAVQVKAYSADQIAQGAKTGQWASLNRKHRAVFTPPPAMSAANAVGAGGIAGADGATNATGTSGAANASDATGTETAGTTQAAPGSSVSAVAWSDVAPSSGFILTDIGLAKLVRPRNWQVIAPQQQGQSITIAPSAGMVSGGVGYGVVINSMTPADGSGNIDQITNEIASNLESGESGLQTVSNITAISVGGVRGREVDLESTSPFLDANGRVQKESDHLVTVSSPDGSTVYFVFISPKSDLNRLRPTFDRMLQSVQF